MAQVVCPSMSESTTGFCGVTGSRSSTDGNSPPDNVWSQRPPTIQAPGPSSAARAAMRRVHSSRSAMPVRSTPRTRERPDSRWRWPSIRPGIAARPPSSMTSVASPIQVSMPLEFPTNTNRPPCTAKASATGRSASLVWITPPRATRSAGPPSGGASQAVEQANKAAKKTPRPGRDEFMAPIVVANLLRRVAGTQCAPGGVSRTVGPFRKRRGICPTRGSCR